MSKDIGISPVGASISGAVFAGGTNNVQLSKKPAHLIYLDFKSKNQRYFITLDRPDFIQGFVLVKGFFCDAPETVILETFTDLLTSVKKDLICEMMFPIHKIFFIRSLVFNAK